jgi:mannose-1-phosphate guanylyltransferase
LKETFKVGNKPDVRVVIMAGGGGTRFWPWSREELPKQLLPILSDRSMVRQTVDRLRTFTPPDKIFIVTSRSQSGKIRAEVPQIPESNLLVEPAGRNTAPCLCLAAMTIRKPNPDSVMVVLPADHAIADRRGFLRTLGRAKEFAARKDVLITLGIQPSAPETGYGYIQKGAIIGQINGTKVFQAKAFREKPTLNKARAYLRRGDYLWNSGMFIWKVGVFLEAVEKFLPELWEEMAALESAWGTSRERKVLEQIYERCQPISVDYGILEKAKNVALIEARFRWDDVGSWSALWKIRPKTGDGNAMIPGKKPGEGKILALDSSGCLIRGEKKLIALLGMKETAVVEAGDAILVCPLDRSQEVRRILEELKRKGWREYL